MAFGFSRDEIKFLNPSQIVIKWKRDLDAVKYEMKQSGKTPDEWAKGINLSMPVDIVFEDGKFKLDDGHHRYMAALILNKVLPVNVEIKDKPHFTAVKKALALGEKVPEEVLRDYPELLKGRK